QAPPAPDGAARQEPAPKQATPKKGEDAKGGEKTAAPPADISGLIGPILARHDLPGMAAVVVTRKGITARGVTGVRQREFPERLTLDDRFHLGSCLKAMTSSLTAIFVKEGKLRWDSTLAELFPERLGGEGSIHEDYRDVTVEQLLSHHGGCPQNLMAGGLWSTLLMHQGTPREARAILVREVIKNAPAVRPGVDYLYSNAGYAIVGHALERIAKVPFEELIQTQMFKPLGITTAGFGPAWTDAEKRDQPIGHRPDGSAVTVRRFADNPLGIAPAGCGHMTLADWSRFIRWHLNGAADIQTPLLDQNAFDRLHRPEVKEHAYALGWLVGERPWAGGRVLYHDGTNTMNYCIAWLAPERGFAVMVACNQGGDSAAKAADELVSELIRYHLERNPSKEAGKGN
ncbi:MAG: serine hydrolase domain-containing protein, partial [Planctomycetota bacterium]